MKGVLSHCKSTGDQVPVGLGQRILDWLQYCIAPLRENPTSVPCYLDTSQTPAMMRLSTEQKSAMIRSLLELNTCDIGQNVSSLLGDDPHNEATTYTAPPTPRSGTLVDRFEVTTTNTAIWDATTRPPMTLVELVRPPASFSTAESVEPTPGVVASSNHQDMSDEMMTVIADMYPDPFMPLSAFIERIHEGRRDVDEYQAAILRMEVQRKLFTFTWIHDFIVENESKFRIGRGHSLIGKATLLAASKGYSAAPDWGSSLLFWYSLCVQPLLVLWNGEPPCVPAKLVGGESIMRLSKTQSRKVLLSLFRQMRSPSLNS